MHPGGGLVYQPMEEPEITFKAKNDFSETIEAYPIIRTHCYSYGSLIEEKKYPKITLSAKESSVFNLTLEGSSRPSSYLAELVLYDVETNLPISETALYRWIVTGQSAHILSLSADQSSYLQNQEAIVRIQIAGSADHSMPTQEGDVTISIYDQLGEMVGQAQKTDIRMVSGQDILINVPIIEDVVNPQIVLSVSSGDVILDEYQVASQDENFELPIVTRNWRQKYQKLILVLAFALVVLTFLAFYFKNSKAKENRNKKEKFYLLLAFLLIGFSVTLSAQAAVEVTGGCCDTSVRFINPAPPSPQKPAYLLGEEIRFTGSFRATACGDGLFFNKISFYITEDKDIPIVDCCGQPKDYCPRITNCLCSEGCQYAYGAKSRQYLLQDIQNIKWCDAVKTLDSEAINPETNHPYGLYKIGEIYPGDVPQNHVPYSVEYDESFVIPENIPLSGNVRFYVIYSGTHWNTHWHWSITYQEGYITQGPIIKETWEDWDYVNAPLQPILNWNYYSQDDHPQAKYRIVLGEKPNFENSLIKTDWIPSSAASYGVPAGLLKWNTNYYWKVQAQDSYEQKSNWSQVSNFKTPRHANPDVEFNWSPNPIYVQEEITFVDQSISYGGSQIVSRYWSFVDRNTKKQLPHQT